VVLQAVHRLMDLRAADSWAGQNRQSRLVFIGRNLDKDALDRGLRSCLE
jgi:G3E family GTPase